MYEPLEVSECEKNGKLKAQPEEPIRIGFKFMSEWWKTAKNILRGKAKGSKLMVLGIS